MQMIIIVHNQQSANVNQLRIKGDINAKKNRNKKTYANLYQGLLVLIRDSFEEFSILNLYTCFILTA